MYHDKRKRYARKILLTMLLLAVLAGLFAGGSAACRQELARESAAALKAAVARSALQCYVVEGVYPPDLRYLEDHYGLRVNRKDYYITYDVFASNQPPDIRVTARPQ